MDTSSLQSAVASAAGVGVSDVTISVRAASVAITAVLSVPSYTTAAAVSSRLSSSMGTAASASAALGLTVLSEPLIVASNPQSSSSSGFPIAAAVGGGAGGVLVLGLASLLHWYRRKRSSRKLHPQGTGSKSVPTPAASSTEGSSLSSSTVSAFLSAPARGGARTKEGEDEFAKSVLADDAREVALAKVGLTSTLVLDYKKGKRCSFWFIRAAKLRSFSGKTPPRMQELRRDHPDWLERREISFADGHAGHYVSDTLVISHRWEDSVEPDGGGVQFSAIKKHLLANKAIKWVWFDFWSMPQGRDKTEVEDIEFTMMLPNINLLYLFCSVLILLDGSYMSRFWTQFEAFLSFRKVTASGLGPTPLSERRDAIICIHNADSEFDPPKLRKMWGQKTADEAHAVLARPDVTVTNQRDKEVQLPKLQKLNEFAKSVLAGVQGAFRSPESGDPDGWEILAA